ncbi:MAG: CotH kinase family protein [Melioribacteraceae bacterium]
MVDTPLPKDYGLPVYSLIIDEEDYGLFKKNVYSNLKINGTLIISGKEYKIKIRHQGFSSRGNFKKNYIIEYEMSDPILSCPKIILSAQAIDPSMVRSFVTSEIFKHTDLYIFDIHPVVFYINGNYEGLYFLIEPVNLYFFLRRNVKVDELYKAFNGNAFFSYELLKDVKYGYEKEYPEDENFRSLEKLISITSSNTEDFPGHLEKVFDVEKFLQYWVVTILTYNWDGVIHNFYLLKNGSTGKYEVVPWDLDRTFVQEGSLTAFPGGNYLIQKLMNYEKYRTMYKNYFRKILNDSFREDVLFPKIDSLKSLIIKAYYDDRWILSNGYDINYETEKVKSFIKERIIYIENQLRNFQ